MKPTYRHTKNACYLGYTVSAIVNNFAPLLYVLFQTDFGISMGQLSFLITFNFGVQTVVDSLGAYVADKIGYRSSMIAANLFAAGGLILMSVLPFVMTSFYGLVIATFVYAIGSGMLEVVVNPIIAALPSEESTASMSFLHSFYCWGHVAMVLLSTLYFSIFGTESWRYLCILWAMVPLLDAAVFIRVPIRPFINEREKISVKSLFGIKIFWIFLILMFCAGASEMAMSQWASLFAETALGMPKVLGDLFGPCMFAVAMGLSRIFYGKMVNRLNLTNYIFVSALLCVVSYFLCALSPNGIFSLLGCALCGFSVGVMWPGVLSLASIPCARGGTALFGLLAMMGDVGCFLGPNTAAAISEHFLVGDSPMKAGLLGCAIFPLVMIGCIARLKYMKDRKRV